MSGNYQNNLLEGSVYELIPGKYFFGWTVHVPAGWEIIPQDNINFVLNNRNRLYKYALDINTNSEQDDLLFIRKKTGFSS